MSIKIKESEFKQMIKEEVCRMNELKKLEDEKAKIQKELDELYSDEEVEDEEESEEMDELFGSKTPEQKLTDYIAKYKKVKNITNDADLPKSMQVGTPQYKSRLDAVTKFKTANIKWYQGRGWQPVKYAAGIDTPYLY